MAHSPILMSKKTDSVPNTIDDELIYQKILSTKNKKTPKNVNNTDNNSKIHSKPIPKSISSPLLNTLIKSRKERSVDTIETTFNNGERKEIQLKNVNKTESLCDIGILYNNRINDIPDDYKETPRFSNNILSRSLGDLPPLKIRKKNCNHEALTNNLKKNTRKKKVKKEATKEEINMVYDAIKYAEGLNVETILKDKYQDIIEYRDKKYEECKLNNINSKSEIKIRLKYIGKVVEYLYYHVEPPNKYTKDTDRLHFKEVASNAIQFYNKKYGTNVPITIVIGAWFHDIERFIPETKCKYLPETVDKIRKQVIHPITSYKVAQALLKGAPLTKIEFNRIKELIIHHDSPDPSNDIKLNNKILLNKVTNNSLMKELRVLMDADSFAFFQSTISLFIQFKAKTNTPEWIGKRVMVNLMRLNSGLRINAYQLILKIPNSIQRKMHLDFDELQDIIFSKNQDKTKSAMINNKKQ